MKKSVDTEEFIENTKKDLEKKIKDMITDKHILSVLEGKKRLRALLSQLAYKACTQGEETSQQYQKALEGSVVIELAHAAALVHDDIIDQDCERRNKPAYLVKNGVAGTLLTGHKMLAIGFSVALKHGDEWVRLYVDSWDEVINGVLDEINLNKNGFSNGLISSKSKKIDAYNKKIERKTAALFSSVCKAGALEAAISGDALKVFEDYGQEIGLAYQLADDLVDLANGEMREGVIILLLKRLRDIGTKINTLKKKELKRKFAKNKDNIQEIFIEEINRHIEKAEELGKSKIIPDSPYKDMLSEFPRYIINEMLKEIKIAV
ncbi:MAG: polyprenyl synthetase family protein [Thermoplasmatales archaeon]|nr:polyprenyl synthetase family protein [Thermoplasmatales archaeon]